MKLKVDHGIEDKWFIHVHKHDKNNNLLNLEYFCCLSLV